MVQYELSRICNYSATCPQSEKPCGACFFEEIRDFTTMGEEKKFSTEEKCYLMG